MRSELLRAPSLTKSSVEHHTILIIEDDKGLNKLIAKHLRREGFETHSAFTGGETLSTLKQNQNMILLMDYKLPDMTATEVLGKLADWKWMGPFLIMTGHGDEQIAVELMKQGAIDYIVKDTNFLEAIPQKIKRACNIIEQQQKLARAEEEISRLASFPEINPNPVLQIELSGRLRYINPAAQTAFPEISEKGLNHPFLKGLSEMLVSLRRKHEEIVTREIHVGKEWYHQTISYISNIHCIHIYSLNITNIKQMQEQLISSLQEKEILFRELYHRTKNNMQVISSMLSLKARYTKNKAVTATFKEIENKISSMALVHQKLYESKDLSHLNLKEYISDLILLFKRSQPDLSGRITFTTEGKDIKVLIDTAIPVGLIINELITNALKHAFPGTIQGEIKIKFSMTDKNELAIEISDNGIGLPKGFDIQKDSHLGLELVNDLVEHQLQGKINYESKEGLVWHILLKEELYEPRI